MEQTSATVCPMTLALDYMQKTDTVNADVSARANKYVDQGYKRLLTFESKKQPGGFALWTKGNPSVFLTAYGLMQFTDMKNVYAVSPELLTRIGTYLRNHQSSDGSFRKGNLVHSWGSWKETPFYMTAYVAWALAHAGEDTTRALAYLEEHADDVDDPYGIALAAMAFATADPKSTATRKWADRVVATKKTVDGRIGWSPTAPTFVGARGRTADIEATALAALALFKADRRTDLAYEALDSLIGWRGKDGRFGSTNSTALALRALLAADSGGDKLPATGVTIKRRGEVLKRVEIPSGSTEPVRIPLGELDPKSLSVTLDGKGRMRGTLSRTTYEPWDKTTLPRGPLAMTVAWSDEPLAVGETYAAKVTIRHTGKELAKLVTAEIGLPPGITAKPKDVSGKGLSEAERSERGMVLYLDDMKPGEERTYTIPFRTRHAFDAQTAPSRVYEYYVEHEQTVVPPVHVKTR